MTVRRRALPPGWYPDKAEEIRALMREWAPGSPVPRGAPAAVAPHAGWTFSGRLAARSIAALAGAVPERGGTIAVIGGHLPPSAQPLAAWEDGFESPFGHIEAATELREALAAALAGAGLRLGRDEVPDNTVEVQLPLVKAAFPDARILWLRAPNGPGALALGAALAAASARLGSALACLGSTDLTHYGPAYGFAPRGRGSAAAAWVREANDKAFIDALLAMDPRAALERGEEDASACSSGAAAAALSFAIASGARRAELLGYATSLDARRDESFVGYASVAFYR